MRKFNDSDRERKRKRITLPENPANLPADKIADLETAVKNSLMGGYLPCTVAWGIADKGEVPRIAVGAIADKLGLRITDCQLGCFKVDKTAIGDSATPKADSKIDGQLADVAESVSCAAAHELALELEKPPKAIADALNARKLKIGDCQLGCF